MADCSDMYLYEAVCSVHAARASFTRKQWETSLEAVDCTPAPDMPRSSFTIAAETSTPPAAAAGVASTAAGVGTGAACIPIGMLKYVPK